MSKTRNYSLKVSVIIPAYNSEKYLPRCLDSVLAQTLTDIEVIVVNDGSTDKTEEIITQYIIKDSRIKKINQSNKGTSSARNNGIKYAKGDYLCFVDSDDTIHPSMLTTMYSQGISLDSDLVVCRYQKIIQKTNNIYPGTNYNGYTKELLFKNTFGMIIPAPIWGKLYKKSLFNDKTLLFSDNIRHNEDNAFLFKIIYFAKNISFVNKFLYHWHEIIGSKSQSISKERLTDTIKVLNLHQEFLKKRNLTHLYQINFIHACFILTMIRYKGILNYSKSEEEKKSLLKYFSNILYKNNILTIKELLIARKHLPFVYLKYLFFILKNLDISLNFIENFPKNDIELLQKSINSELGLLNNILEALNNTKAKEIYIYGAGEICQVLLPLLEKQYNIVGILDKNAHLFNTKYSYEVTSLEETHFKNKEMNIVIASIEFAEEITKSLQEYSNQLGIKIKSLSYLDCFQ
ncbi:MAG: glycosyltransferase [Sulfurimonadaceae bacterium]